MDSSFFYVKQHLSNDTTFPALAVAADDANDSLDASANTDSSDNAKPHAHKDALHTCVNRGCGSMTGNKNSKTL